jgi:hypothetical protein
MNVKSNAKALASLLTGVVAAVRSIEAISEEIETWVEPTAEDLAAPGRRKISPINRIQRKKEELNGSRAMLVSLQAQSGVPITNEREIEIIKNSINSQFESGDFTGRPKNTEIENLRTQIHQILFKKMVFVTNKYPAIKGSKDGKKIARYNTKLDRFNEQIEDVAESIIDLTGGSYDENVLLNNTLWSGDEDSATAELPLEVVQAPVEQIKTPKVTKAVKAVKAVKAKSSILRALEDKESMGIAALANVKGYRSKSEKESDEQHALSTIIGSKRPAAIEEVKPAIVEEVKPMVVAQPKPVEAISVPESIKAALTQKEEEAPAKSDDVLDMIMKMEVKDLRMALLESISEIEDYEKNYKSLKSSHNSLQKHLNELHDSTSQTFSERRLRKMRLLSM